MIGPNCGVVSDFPSLSSNSYDKPRSPLPRTKSFLGTTALTSSVFAQTRRFPPPTYYPLPTEWRRCSKCQPNRSHLRAQQSRTRGWGWGWGAITMPTLAQMIVVVWWIVTILVLIIRVARIAGCPLRCRRREGAMLERLYSTLSGLLDQGVSCNSSAGIN